MAPMAEADDGATEGDDVGDPVEANDANNDRLTYSLEADHAGTRRQTLTCSRSTG